MSLLHIQSDQISAHSIVISLYCDSHDLSNDRYAVGMVVISRASLVLAVSTAIYNSQVATTHRVDDSQ